MNEKNIIERISAANLRLRCDRVALRVIARVKAGVIEIVPDHQAVIFTVTAPIRQPAKTAAALQRMLLGLHAGELCCVLNGNQVRARQVANVSANMPRVLGFVHDPVTDAGLILKLAASHLSEHGGTAAPGEVPAKPEPCDEPNRADWTARSAP